MNNDYEYDKQYNSTASKLAKKKKRIKEAEEMSRDAIGSRAMRYTLEV